MLFSLILSVCFMSGGLEVCENQTKAKALTIDDCSHGIDLIRHDIESSPFYYFDWAIDCIPER